jgi:hypothetical protein
MSARTMSTTSTCSRASESAVASAYARAAAGASWRQLQELVSSRLPANIQHLLPSCNHWGYKCPPMRRGQPMDLAVKKNFEPVDEAKVLPAAPTAPSVSRGSVKHAGSWSGGSRRGTSRKLQPGAAQRRRTFPKKLLVFGERARRHRTYARPRMDVGFMPGCGTSRATRPCSTPTFGSRRGFTRLEHVRTLVDKVRYRRP